MKIFRDKSSTWEDNINFVDDNDVCVGYSLAQSCCEDAGYFFCFEEPTKIQDHRNDDLFFEKYNFDKDFFKEHVLLDTDCGGSVLFNLPSKDSPHL